LREREPTAITVADWLRTGHGLNVAADIAPDIRQHRLGRYPSIARTLAE
jgi:hypothetical protein